MNDVKNCRIIQDLLPNYIDKITNEDSNKYIEEHLKECDECRKTFENMKKDLYVNSKMEDKKAVKYFKKYRNKLMFLRSMLIISLIIFIIFVGDTVRKLVILSDLSNKAETSINSENYHKIVYSYNKDNTSVWEFFRLGDKKKIIIKSIKPEGTNVVTIYAKKKGTDQWGNERYDTNIYTVTENEKIATQNSDMGIGVDFQNMFYVEEFWQLLLLSIPTSIRPTTYNGEECYYISNFKSIYASSPNGVYVSKKTGLPMNTIAYEIEYSDSGAGRWPAADYSYEFNTVTDNEFIEPDINEYEIQH